MTKRKCKSKYRRSPLSLREYGSPTSVKSRDKSIPTRDDSGVAREASVAPDRVDTRRSTVSRTLHPFEVRYSSAKCSSTSPDSEIGLCKPMTLVARNFPLDITKADVELFFKGKARKVTLFKRYAVDEMEIEENLVAVECRITFFHSEKETKEALKLNGNEIHGKAFYVTREGNTYVVPCFADILDYDKPPIANI